MTEAVAGGGWDIILKLKTIQIIKQFRSWLNSTILNIYKFVNIRPYENSNINKSLDIRQNYSEIVFTIYIMPLNSGREFQTFSIHTKNLFINIFWQKKSFQNKKKNNNRQLFFVSSPRTRKIVRTILYLH